MDAPEFVLPRHVAKRLKRHCNFDCVTVLGYHTSGFHNDVETEVFSLTISPNSIGLDSERIEVKLIGFTLIVEGIKKDANVVVIKDVIALGNVRADLIRFVVTVKRDVQKLWVIAEKHFGWFRRRDVIARLSLIEILQHDGFL